MSLKYDPASVPQVFSAMAFASLDFAPATAGAAAALALNFTIGQDVAAGRCKVTWEREFKLPWREAGPPNHHDDKVDSDE